MARQRILHITDTHLVSGHSHSLYDVDTKSAFEGVIRKAMSSSPSPDLIIHTGDVADDGSFETYRLAQEILSVTQVPMWVVPGNHDNIAAMQDGLVSANIFLNGYYERGNWAFVMLNSQVVNHSHGIVSPDELVRLRDRLDRAGDRHVLIALHHTPLIQCPLPGCQLVNRDEFLAILAQFPNVRLVIAGHTHAALSQPHAHYCVTTSPAVFAQISHEQNLDSARCQDSFEHHQIDRLKHGFRIIDLDNNGRFENAVHWL